VEVYTGKDLILAVAKNLSLGGVGISTQILLPEGSEVGLSMFLVEEGIEDEATAPLNVRGQVVWSGQEDKGGYQAGIRFLPMNPNQQQAISYFLNRLNQ
jgi:c-di-GMP-binding flagellar brake protein YcgR